MLVPKGAKILAQVSEFLLEWIDVLIATVDLPFRNFSDLVLPVFLKDKKYLILFGH